MAERPIVYVVDDDPSVRRALVRLIRAAGLDAAASESARDFLASDHSRRPACLVLDVRLPGMSGPELQRRIAASEPDLRVVVITAHVDDPLRRQILETGAVAFLTKPFDDEELLEAIDRALRPCPNPAV